MPRLRPHRDDQPATNLNLIGRPEEDVSFRLDLHFDQIAARCLGVDRDSEARSIWRRHISLRVALDMVGSDMSSQRLRSERILTYFVRTQAGVGLQRGAERQMRGESMVHKSYAA